MSVALFLFRIVLMRLVFFLFINNSNCASYIHTYFKAIDSLVYFSTLTFPNMPMAACLFVRNLFSCMCIGINSVWLDRSIGATDLSYYRPLSVIHVEEIHFKHEYLSYFCWTYKWDREKIRFHLVSGLRCFG